MSESERVEGREYDVQGVVRVNVTVMLTAPFTDEEARAALIGAVDEGDPYVAMVEAISDAE